VGPREEVSAGPTITKDGREPWRRKLNSRDPLENMGRADGARKVASKTSDVAGDGTTHRDRFWRSASFREGREERGRPVRNPMELKRGIERAVESSGRGSEESYSIETKDQRKPSPRSAPFSANGGRHHPATPSRKR